MVSVVPGMIGSGLNGIGRKELRVTTEPLEDTPGLRKARGAFFTPAAVCDFLARWAIRSPEGRVLEPSCGEADILRSAAVRLLELGGSTPVRGHELHAESARRAQQVLAAIPYPGEIQVGDFLDVPAEPGFTAVIGNPPYIRYHGFTGESRTRGLKAALAQGVRLSSLASSWAPFVVHSAGFVREGGRLGLVLPAELLSSNYAAEVRDHLLRRFGSVSVVLFDGQVFPGVQTEALLLLAEGSGGTDHVRFASVSNADNLEDVGFLTTLPVLPGEKWTSAMVSPSAQATLANLASGGSFAPLGDWGRINLGTVTGNNGYFTLTPHEVAGRGLERDVIPISPAGSAHLRALEFGAAQHAALGSAGARTLLFRPLEPGPAARKYIRLGEQQGVPRAYKCRVRDPWWRVPVVDPPDLFFTYMNAHTPQLAANPMGLSHLNSVHGIYLTDERRQWVKLLPLACLNSVTALSAEVVGRAYGGGILKMEPREATRLLAPSPAVVGHERVALERLLPKAKLLLAEGRLDAVTSMVDDVLLRSGGAVTPAEITEIRASRSELGGRRRSRSSSRRSSARAGTQNPDN